MKIIGIIQSPYKEKFSIPHQSLQLDIEMKIQIQSPFNREEAFVGLGDYSHIWILFLFSEINEDEEKLSVRPPRLGGNSKQGVFATRSPYRPNRIGMSVVKLLSVHQNEILISGGDFLDGTPVIDIKPYLVGTDCIGSATSSWSNQIENKRLNVRFENNVQFILAESELAVVEKIFTIDPRPKFHEDLKKDYATKVYQYDFHYRIENDDLIIFKIIKL
jgi:tRNA-Thr(GGU) m(6)t(6)A37 methyltransferase TsaA